MSDRRRNLFILLFVAALALASFGVALATSPRLGLDLRGGIELVYKASPAVGSGKVAPDDLNRAVEVMRKRIDPTGTREPEIQTTNQDQISIALPGFQDPRRAQELVGRTARLYFYDWETNVIGADGKPAPDDPDVTGTGGNNIPGGGQTALSHYDAVIRGSKRTPQATRNRSHDSTFFLVNDKKKTVVAGPAQTERDVYSDKPDEAAKQRIGTRVAEVPAGTTILQALRPEDANGNPGKRPNRWYVLQDHVALQGSDVKNPVQSQDELGKPAVSFDFTSKGRKAFQSVTRTIADRGEEQSIGGTGDQHFAVALDNQLLTVPSIDAGKFAGTGIDGNGGAQITGGFTIAQARDLADLLRTGALPVNLEQISNSQVSAVLGAKSLDQAVVAGAIGFAVVALFLLLFYRVLGLLAITGLVIYSLFFYALALLIPITLTLPGIAGLILTIGVAADANIVIFERIKEEVRGGRAIAPAIAAGYKRGLTAIVDANVVTFVVAFILFTLATAGVKGFAFTLGIGTLVSFLTAVVFTQAVLGTLGSTRLVAGRGALGAGTAKAKPPRRFDFMGRSRLFFSLSGVILAVGAFAIGTNGVPLGDDFEGGTKVTAQLNKAATEADIRSTLEAKGFKGEKIQRESGKGIPANTFKIRFRKLAPARTPQIREALDAKYGIGDTYSTTAVGPTFGKQIANTAILAIIASLIAISFYIWIRFEWKYAVPVLIALTHDILIVAGVYAAIGSEVTSATVAALLTILGYSLYDTIIVFDRIRENVPRMPRATYSQIVNQSMAEVLTRSLATSLCTLLPVTALYLFGGETLKDFALALIIGTISGAYSSIFIASPVLVHWKERETLWSRRRKTVAAEHGGAVPAYADQPKKTADEVRAPRPTGLSADNPDAVSEEDFQEMVRELGIDASATHLPGAANRAQRREQARAKAPAVEPDVDPNDPAAQRRAEARRRREQRQNRTSEDS